MQWSIQQQSVFEWFKSGSGNLVVRARAGTGKTTTIIEAITHAPEARVLLCAFNKRIATELQSRLSNPRAQAQTLHSVGFGIVRRYWEGVKVSTGNDRAWALAKAAAGEQAPDPMLRLVAKLHTLAREMAPLAQKWETLYDIAIAHDCLPDEDWEEEGWDAEHLCRMALQAMVIAAKRKPTDTGIDFADMLFLPVRNQWLTARFDLVVVDEAQDMNSCQLLIAQGVCKGRMAVVGDDRQAIYGFRGADSGSIDRLSSELDATELPLTITYRCGKNIVAEAQRIVPDFEAGPDNQMGEIRRLPFKGLVDECQVGDFILSRKNAPLVSVALRVLRSGKRCKIEGRDIGAGLLALIKKLTKGKAATSMPAFLEKLSAWEEREVVRASRAGKGADARIERVRDQADTLRSLSEGLSGIRELQTRCEDLFADGGGSRVVCSSVHKAKGLEAERVYVLADSLIVSTKKQNAKQSREEDNIEYVAITRAKHSLVWVDGLPGRNE